MHDASGKSERVGKALLIEDIKTPDGETPLKDFALKNKNICVDEPYRQKERDGEDGRENPPNIVVGIKDAP